MKNKILANLSYWLCGFLGIWQFILLAIPYLASFAKYDGVRETYGTASGYQIMRLWDGGFSGVMSALLQIFILVLGIVMLVYGACGILKSVGVFEKFPDKLGKCSMKKWGEIALYAYVGLNVLLFIFLIVLTAQNTYTYEYTDGTKLKSGIAFSAGMFITLAFVIGAPVALKWLEAKCPVDEGEAAIMRAYICTKCGKKTKKGAKFCSECGGEVEEKVNAGYACTQCGAKAKEGDNFCSSCGGKIEPVQYEREVSTPVEEVATDEKTEESATEEVATTEVPVEETATEEKAE